MSRIDELDIVIRHKGAKVSAWNTAARVMGDGRAVTPTLRSPCWSRNGRRSWRTLPKRAGSMTLNRGPSTVRSTSPSRRGRAAPIRRSRR